MEQYAMYLRKSRFDRDFAELSVEETLKRHEAILDHLAREHGYTIAKTYYEVVSGESIAARPEIQKLLEEVNEGRYAGVLVVDVERLARGNGADQARISQIFQFSGTRIITPMKTYDPANEFDEEYFEFGLFMSRREYKTINRRLVRGRDSSAAEGKYISSIAPYGYTRVKLEGEKGYTLTPKPDEAREVVRMFEMCLQHQGTKLIANDLNDRQVPTRHGQLWDYATVAQMLSNPVYMGKIRRGWSRQIRTMENGEVKKRIRRSKRMEDYQLYEGRHPALVSEATFMQAQELRLARQYGVKVKADCALQNAFAGLMYCGCCGKRITRTTMKDGRARLRCVNGRNCHNVSADYPAVEQAVIEALRGWLDGYQVKVEGQDDSAAAAALQAGIEAAQQEAERLQAQLENAYDLVEQGVYTTAFFKERRETLNRSLDEARHGMERQTRQLDELRSANEQRRRLIPSTEALLEHYDDMTAEERNRLLKTILARIVYQKSADGRVGIDLYPLLPKG